MVDWPFLWRIASQLPRIFSQIFSDWGECETAYWRSDFGGVLPALLCPGVSEVLTTHRHRHYQHHHHYWYDGPHEKLEIYLRHGIRFHYMPSLAHVFFYVVQVVLSKWTLLKLTLARIVRFNTWYEHVIHVHSDKICMWFKLFRSRCLNLMKQAELLMYLIKISEQQGWRSTNF